MRQERASSRERPGYPRQRRDVSEPQLAQVAHARVTLLPLTVTNEPCKAAPAPKRDRAWLVRQAVGVGRIALMLAGLVPLSSHAPTFAFPNRLSPTLRRIVLTVLPSAYVFRSHGADGPSFTRGAGYLPVMTYWTQLPWFLNMP